MWNAARLAWLFVAVCLFLCIDTLAGEHGSGTASPSLADMQQVVAKARGRVAHWDGPVIGPPGRPGMTIAVICEDLRNGGVLAVARGIGEAADVMGWRVRMLDAHGTPEGRLQKIAAALAMKPDGAVLVGSDARSLEPHLAAFVQEKIPLVGWHVGPTAGRLASGSVAINVSTDPLEVAQVTAMATIVESRGEAGVVIFTDSNFEIAMSKANEMAKVIEACEGCTVLEVLRLPISQSAQRVPEATRKLLARYGERWSHALAINDIYFDYATPELIKAGREIHLYSAGDGSPAAFLRIRAGAFQYGTVAEPLNLQGWQLVDELNRLLAGRPVSGYIPAVHLVTAENIDFDGGPRMLFDPDNGYREAYRRLWKR